MRTQPLRIRREFVQKDNPRIRTDDYPYNAKRRGVSFSRAFLNAIAPRPSATPDESPDRVGPSCLRWAHLCLLCAQFKPEGTRTVAGHPAHPFSASYPQSSAIIHHIRRTPLRRPAGIRTPSLRQKNRAVLTFPRHVCLIRRRRHARIPIMCAVGPFLFPRRLSVSIMRPATGDSGASPKGRAGTRFGMPAHPCIVPKRGEATTKQPASATGRPHRPTPPYDSSSSRFFLPLKSGQTPVPDRR